MARSKQIRYSEEQPNSSSREEFLIVMDYLQNYAYDKEHAASQVDIVNYAKEHYGKEIRRDRISQILIHLEQISSQNPHLLPFVLKIYDLKKIRKYYVPQKQFDEDEIAKIVSAINTDKKLSANETKRLINKILNTTTNKETRLKVVEMLNHRKGHLSKASEAFYDVLSQFEKLCDNYSRIVFKLIDPREAEHSSRRAFRYIDDYREESFGYAYSTYDVNGITRAVIYDDVHKNAIVTKFDNLKILRTNTVSKHTLFGEEFELDVNDEDKSINNWLDKHYSGADGLQHMYYLKTTIGNKDLPSLLKQFEDFKAGYKKYWHKNLEYTVKDREVVTSRNDENGNVVDEVVIIQDAYFEIKSNRSSFNNWYIDKKNYTEAVLLDPSYLADRHLKAVIDRYARRMNKYGKKYNVTVNYEIKPEYAEEQKALFERLKARNESINETEGAVPILIKK